MIDRIRNHHLVASDSKIVISHSAFGSEVGYAHCVSPSEAASNAFILALILEEKHGGAPNRGHGAVTLAMLDEAMGRAASQTVNSLCYTASMTTNFCAASRLGQLLVARAQVKRPGKSVVFVDSELYAEDKLIATATGTFVNSGLAIPERGVEVNG